MTKTWTVAQVIGHNVKTRREQLGMTGDDLGRLAGAALTSDGKPWPRQTVYMVERGERAMVAAEVSALAYLLRTTVAELFMPPSEGGEVTLGSLKLRAGHPVFTGAYLSDDERTPTEAALSSLRAAQRAQEAIEAAAREQRWLIYQTQNTLLGLPAPKPRGQGAADLEAANRWYLGAPGEDPLDAAFSDGGYINDDEPPTTK